MPRVRHPDWLHSRLLESNDKMKQKKINELFSTRSPAEQLSIDEENAALKPSAIDMEDQFSSSPRPNVPRVTVRVHCQKRVQFQ